MEQSNIQYRAIRPSDYRALAKIICDTWHYEKICAPKTAEAMSMLYLSGCLANQTYTCVALKNGVPVGIIMGKNEKTHRKSPRYGLKQLTSVLSVLVRSEGRRVLKTFEGFDGINKGLFERCTEKFDGEVAFFAVRSDQRGAGVGRELFGRVQAYMKSEGISDYYLYTDTTCNYGFYEHLGMNRVGEKTFTIKAYNKDMTFFMYAMH
ncbi:MAG: GNAT family N-acetyltransferase [Oscillospiraceae bacterium]